MINFGTIGGPTYAILKSICIIALSMWFITYTILDQFLWVPSIAEIKSTEVSSWLINFNPTSDIICDYVAGYDTLGVLDMQFSESDLYKWYPYVSHLGINLDQLSMGP